MAENEDAPAIAAVPLVGKHDALIERWFAAAFHGSPHMRDTAAFTYVRAQVDELKAALARAQEN